MLCGMAWFMFCCPAFLRIARTWLIFFSKIRENYIHGWNGRADVNTNRQACGCQRCCQIWWATLISFQSILSMSESMNCGIKVRPIWLAPTWAADIGWRAVCARTNSRVDSTHERISPWPTTNRNKYAMRWLTQHRLQLELMSRWRQSSLTQLINTR